MLEGEQNGAPAALIGKNLQKQYRLGEHRSLQQTVNRLLGRNREQRPLLKALQGVDFTVKRGETFGLVGTNGSGKSTLLQVLAGTTLPTGGELIVRGRVLPLLSVGTGFHGELTGRENVTLFASSLGVPPKTIADRMDAVASFAEIERHMDTPVKRFSSGMVSRLSFAIAMQFPADIYVFDEVLAVVDGEFQSRCLDEIQGLHEQGRTVVFVSHDLDQVRDVCSRVMWLEQGQARLTGPADEVIEAYSREHRAHHH
jgi:ABC-type polysaccharide/polyol phosphate transport system ATPase subunit